MICARTPRWVVSAWTPRNSASPTIITSNPMIFPLEPDLLFAGLERRLLAGWHGFLRHGQHHRHHHIISCDGGQVHDLLRVKDFPGAGECLVRNIPRSRQLGDEVVDDGLILSHAGRTLA